MSMIKKDDIDYKRKDLSPEREFLQVSAKKIKTEDFFKPHRHLECKKIANTTQESWVILDGSVKASIYDIDDSFLHEEVLNSGDCIVLFAGAHSLECMTDDTLLYEFKNGPYFGPDKEQKYKFS